MKKIKYVYKGLDLYLGLKPKIVWTALNIMILTAAFIGTKNIIFIALILALILTMTSVLVFTWFKKVKPIIREVQKEIELEEKYQFMYNRFLK